MSRFGPLAHLTQVMPVRREEPVRAISHEVDVPALVSRALDGDRWAEEALYRRHVHELTNVIARLLGRTADVDDVIQDTFVTAFARLSTLRDTASFAGWIRRIAVSACLMRFRRRKLLHTFGLDRSSEDATLDALAHEPSPERLAELRTIDRVLARVAARDRFAWMLHHVEGLTLPETAATLEVSLATTKRAIARVEDVLSALREEGR